MDVWVEGSVLGAQFRRQKYFASSQGEYLLAKFAEIVQTCEMKRPRELLEALFILIVAITIPSCATHSCGKVYVEPKRSDYTFPQFKTNAHVYTVAVTRTAGEPLLIMHGLGGLDGATLEWAKHLSERGWRVYLPLMDSDFNVCDPVKHLSRMRCSGIWNTDATESSGRVLDDMGALANWISERNHDKPIVVVGNCLTGGFPLAMLGQQSVKTAVLCQPALPIKSLAEVVFRLPQSREKRMAFGIPQDQMNASLRALSADPTKHLYGFHYLDDPLASMDKFYWLHQKLGRRGITEKFRPVVLVPQNPRTKPQWWETKITKAKDSTVGPHVTLTGSDEPDRSCLRARFDQLVRP
jgi:dienelactone hydrolase